MKRWLVYSRDNWLKKRFPVLDLDTHILAATDWILHAQGQTGDDGVPHCYDLVQKAWLPSYPETTGYIIPTLFDVASHFDKPLYAEAATKMALWEAEVQLEDGGVRAGHMGAEVIAPTIFNTGQVLFGWARCFKETGSERCKIALQRAADWLLDAMDDDGCWRKFPSPFAPGEVKLYNVRCAFGLIKVHECLGDDKYLAAARANVNWTVAQAEKNGWLPNNCLTANPDSLTHTIAYAMRGILEVGCALNEPGFVEFALNMARRTMALQRGDGAFPARVNSDWSSDYNWSCVTGNSQLALNLLRLYEETGEQALLESAQRANRFNMSLQDNQTGYRDRSGGA
jgi:hypothetical protein